MRNEMHLYHNDTRVTRSVFRQLEISYHIPYNANCIALISPDTGKPGGVTWIVYEDEGVLFRSEEPPYMNYNGDDKKWALREKAAGTNRQGAIDIHKDHFYNWREIAEKLEKKYL